MSPAPPDMLAGRTGSASLAEAAITLIAGLGLAVLGQFAMLPLFGLLASRLHEWVAPLHLSWGGPIR